MVIVSGPTGSVWARTKALNKIKNEINKLTKIKSEVYSLIQSTLFFT